jgi:hypothetical protein
MVPGRFAFLSDRSRHLHGHRYVLPVAVWIYRSGREIVAVGEVMAGLGGQAGRTRVIEALVKLVAFEALDELPRSAQRNSPRYFQRLANPYWELVATYAGTETGPRAEVDEGR